jgi:hypothetical protein
MRPLRTRRAFGVLLGAILAVFLAMLLVAGMGTVVVRRAFPQTTGTLAVPGLGAPVEIVRDRWGIPHVYAKSAHDVFFVQSCPNSVELGINQTLRKPYATTLLRSLATSRNQSIFTAPLPVRIRSGAPDFKRVCERCI